MILDAQIVRMKAKGRDMEYITKKIILLCNTIYTVFQKIDQQLHTRKIDVPLYILSTELVNFCFGYAFCRKNMSAQVPGYFPDGFIKYNPTEADNCCDEQIGILSQLGLTQSLLMPYVREEDVEREKSIYAIPKGAKETIVYLHNTLHDGYHEKVRSNQPILKEIFLEKEKGIHIPSFTFQSETGLWVDVISFVSLKNAIGEEAGEKTFDNTLIVRLYKNSEISSHLKFEVKTDKEGKRFCHMSFDTGHLPINEVFYNFRGGILEFTPILQQANLVTLSDIMSSFPGGRNLAQRLSQEIVDEILKAYLATIERQDEGEVHTEVQNLLPDMSSFSYSPATEPDAKEVQKYMISMEQIQNMYDGFSVGVLYTKEKGLYELVSRGAKQFPLEEDRLLFQETTGMELPEALTLRKITLQNRHKTIHWENLYTYLRHFGLEDTLYTKDGKIVKHGSSHKKVKRVIYKDGRLQEVSPPRVQVGEIPIGTLHTLLKEIGLKKELFYYVVENLGRIKMKVNMEEVIQHFRKNILAFLS